VDSCLDELHLGGSIYNTVTLCSCILRSAMEMVQDAQACLGRRGHIGASVISRSVVEHLVDLRLLATRNDAASNRRFANYHRLILYFNRNDLTIDQAEIPRIEKEYKEYVRKEFPDIIQRHTKTSNDLALEDWDAIDEKMRNHYQWKGWSGANVPKRIKEILRRSKAAVPLRKGDPYMDNARVFFARLSLFTHPSPYSSIPQFDPRKLGFKFRHKFSDDFLYRREKLLILMLWYGVEAFSHSLPREHGERFLRAFEVRLSKSQRMLAELLNELNS
jgi:hypothetical protein